MATRAMVIRTVEDVEEAIPGVLYLLATLPTGEQRERLSAALSQLTNVCRADLADMAEAALETSRRPS